MEMSKKREGMAFPFKEKEMERRKERLIDPSAMKSHSITHSKSFSQTSQPTSIGKRGELFGCQ